MRSLALGAFGLLVSICVANANPIDSGFKVQDDSGSYGWRPVPDDENALRTEVDLGIEMRVEEVPEVHQDFSDKTLYEVLAESASFSRILKAVDFDKPTAELLKDESINITLFAPDDTAIPKRPDRKKGFTPHEYSLASIVDDLDSALEDDDADKKKMIKDIVHAILMYHILPQNLDGRQLGVNKTYATALTASDGSFGGEPRRVQFIPSVFRKGGTVNLYAKIKTVDIRAKNGIIHVINHPLIPPFSILEETFLLQDAFSIWTSSLQKVNLSGATEYRVLPEKFGMENITSAPAVTTFIPINSAWRRLPKTLQLYLFSPFGTRALKKLLQFHIIPDFVFHADWSYNASTLEGAHVREARVMSLVGISADTVNTHTWGRYDNACNFGSSLDINSLSSHPMEFRLRPDKLHLSMTGHERMLMTGCPNPPAMPKFPAPPRPPVPPKIPPQKPPKSPKPPKVPHHPNLPKPPTPPRHPPHPGPRREKPKLLVNSTIVLPTLLGNHSITIHTTKVESHWLPPSLTATMTANGVPVVLADGVSRNGAVHIISRILNPRPRHAGPPHPHPAPPKMAMMEHIIQVEDEDEDDWEDWREWLPQWAAGDF